LNDKRKKSKGMLFGLLVLVVVVPVVGLLVIRMEGQPPTMKLDLAKSALGTSQTVTLEAADAKSGLQHVWMAIFKDGKESVILNKDFPSGGLLSGPKVRSRSLEVLVEPKELGIKDGKAMLRMVVRDHSWRKWGAGNQIYIEQEVVIDTKPPAIDVVSRPLNLNQGGAGLVIYRLSEDCPTSGVRVGESFYPGMAGPFEDSTLRMAFIALSHKQGAATKLSISANDYAGNEGIAGLQRHINARRFKKDRINISDQFLSWKMPEFRDQVPAAGPGVDTFLKVNRDLRVQNYEIIKQVTARSDAKLHWQGGFKRLPGAANRAGYADYREYIYNKKIIDRQTHMGIDLASNERAPIPAANTGRVAFTDTLGIYGRTVIIDHGFGLFSLYAHLSHIDVTVDDMVTKGQIIGKTGSSGMAGGDHLHFSMLVYHTFVNPIEWWDRQWIQNNIQSKIDSVQ
jgi:murein DD-endopeptidase MepM/ murein hydrolase activator NlpD